MALAHLPHPDSARCASSGKPPCSFATESPAAINKSAGQEVLEPGAARSAQPILLTWGKTLNSALQCGSSKHPPRIKTLLS